MCTFLAYSVRSLSLTTAYRFDYASRYPEARKDIAAWLKDGSLKRRFHVIKGLQNAPEAINLLYSGGNTGKLYAVSSIGTGTIADFSLRAVQVSDISAKL